MAYLMRKYTPCRWTQERHDVSGIEDIAAEVFCDLNAEK